MRITIDLDLEKAVRGRGTTQLLRELEFKRSTLGVLEVEFVRGVEVVELPNDATGKFEIKETGKYDDDPLTGAASWTKVGTGANTYYLFAFSLITTDLDAAFKVDGDASNDVPVITAMCEISWRYDSRDRKTQTITARLNNDVNRDGDTIPDSVAIVYVRDSFIRFGTGAPDNGVGVDGDAYYRTSTGDLYFRVAGVYTLEDNLHGKGAGFSYKFNSATSGNPGTGKLLVDNATFASATHLLVHKTDDDGNDLGTFLTKQDDSTSSNKCLVIARKRGGTDYLAFYLTGALTDNTTYDTFPIAPISLGGTIANGDSLEVSFFRIGDKGDSGGVLTQNYSTTTTDADPGSGIFRFNNATIASVTAAYLDNNETGGSAISAWLDSFDDSTSSIKGYVTFKGVTSPTAFAVFAVTGSVVDGTGYRKLTLTYISSGGTFTNGETFGIAFSRTGNVGTPGTNGTNGPGYLATSTSSLSIGTGSKAFTTQAGLAYTAGCRARASSAADTTNFMEGVVTAYSGTTLTVLIDRYGGSGSHNDWNINLAGDAGETLYPVSVVIPAGATANVDWTLAPTRVERLLAANSTFTHTNLVDGKVIIIPIKQDASTPYTLDWVGVDEWQTAGGVAPDSPALSKIVLFTFVKCGSKIYGNAARQT